MGLLRCDWRSQVRVRSGWRCHVAHPYLPSIHGRRRRSTDLDDQLQAPENRPNRRRAGERHRWGDVASRQDHRRGGRVLHRHGQRAVLWSRRPVRIPEAVRAEHVRGRGMLPDQLQRPVDNQVHERNRDHDRRASDTAPSSAWRHHHVDRCRRERWRHRTTEKHVHRSYLARTPTLLA